MKQIALIALAFCWIQVCSAQDSSTYLGNNQRTGAVDASVPETPVLQWVYKEKHAPIHAWKDPSREVQFIDFDYASNVAIADGLAIFGSSADHTVRALDLVTGNQRWILRLEAPVRFDPVVGDGCVYVAGDDGFVRCVKTQTGEEIWKLRMGPRNTRCIGNDQLMSRWPARSGVLLDGDKLYCTGGMWSRDGVVIYCLESKSGNVIWKNDTSGYHFTEMPHGEAFSGVAPQGNLVLYKDVLYVPTGRAEPAFFDATTGEFHYYATGVGYKAQYPGGTWVTAAHDRVWFKRRTNHNETNIKEPDGIRDPGPSSASGIIGWNYKTGQPEMALVEKSLAAFKDDIVVMSGYGPVIRASYTEMVEKYKDYFDGKKNVAIDPNIKPPESYGQQYKFASDFLKTTGRGNKARTPDLKRAYPMFMTPAPFAKWEADLGRVFFLRIAKNKVIAGGRGKVNLLDLDSGSVLWSYDVDGEARNVAVVEGKFVVSTTTGHLYCFGSSTNAKGTLVQTPTVQEVPSAVAAAQATQILKDSKMKDGYCLLLGAGSSPDLMMSLIQQSDLVVYGLEPDADKAAMLRERLDLAGYLGVRGQVQTDSLDPLPFNPYIADLVVFGSQLGSGIGQVRAEEIYRVTRPCGGVAYGLDESANALAGAVSDKELKTVSAGVMLSRGDIPGAGEWTHPMGNVGRTGCSNDEVAKTPLSLLWWGGPGSARGMERHVYPPVPIYSNGRLYIQGENDVYAVNAYNGRELWNRHFKNVGRWPQFARGGNIVADDDFVYMVYGTDCYALDGATGETVREYVIDNPDQYQVVEWTKKHSTNKNDSRDIPEWDFLAVTDDYVIGTLCASAAPTSSSAVGRLIGDPHESHVVFVYEKESGKLLWTEELEQVVASNAIVSDGKTMFLLDRTNEAKVQFSRRRGQTDVLKSTLRAFDLKTGQELWSQATVNPIVKELLYKDGVIVAGPSRGGGDTSMNSAVAAFDSKTGSKMWGHDDLGVFNAGGRNVSRQVTFIVDETLYVVPHAFHLKTGEVQKPLTDPITGEAACFEIRGQNFCGGVTAGKHITAYRSTSVGLQDIGKNSGSFWLPEVRSSCEISLIPAGGLILAPEGSSTCVCSFSYKTSLALFPEPKKEDWSLHFDENTYGPHKKKNHDVKPFTGTGPVKHLSLNLGAPGDKTDQADKTWFCYPREWTKSNKFLDKSLPVKATGIDDSYHLNADRHPIKNTDRPWLYTSGLYGPVELKVKTNSNDSYTVILHFAEVSDTSKEPRVFDVKVGGIVVSNVNVVRDAGGANTALVKTFSGVKPEDKNITIKLIPKAGQPPVLCAVEVNR